MTRKEKIHQNFALKPIKTTLDVFVPILLVYMAFMFFVVNPRWPTEGVDFTLSVMVALARIAITIICCYFIGIILGENGYKFTFGTKGFFKGLLVASPLFAVWIFNALYSPINVPLSFDETQVPYLVHIIIHELSTGLWEEAFFRGVLMLPILLYLSPHWNVSVKERLQLVFVCGALFGLLHFNQGLFGIFTTGIYGLLFSAAFVYSKNLLVLMLMHFLNNAFFNVRTLLAYADTDAVYNRSGSVYVFIITFAVVAIIASVYATKKAKPFK